MYNWCNHTSSPNQNKDKVKDFRATNKSAIRQKYLTSNENYEFRMTNTLYKKFKEGTNRIKIKLPEEDFAYGRPTEVEDPMKLVIANDYGEREKLHRQTMYEKETNKSKAGKLNGHIVRYMINTD
jgi:hypothetical protein